MPIYLITLPIVLAVLKVSVIAAVGYFLARRGVLHEAALADLSVLIINAAVPCLVFSNAAAGLSALSVGSASMALASGVVVVALAFAVGNACGRALKIRDAHWRAVMCASTFGNSAYLPMAVATAALPPLAHHFATGLATAPGAIAGNSIIGISLFGVLYSPLFWGLGLWWLRSQPGHAPKGVAGWIKTLAPPPVIGVACGYLVGLTPIHHALTPPDAPLHFLFAAIEDIGSLAVPLANLVLGGMLAHAMASRVGDWRDGLAVVAAKLILAPAIVIAAMWLTRHAWFHSPAVSVMMFVALLETTSPPATNLAVISRSLPIDDPAGRLIPSLMLVSYPMAILTMPIWLTLFFVILGGK